MLKSNFYPIGLIPLSMKTQKKIISLLFSTAFLICNYLNM